MRALVVLALVACAPRVPVDEPLPAPKRVYQPPADRLPRTFEPRGYDVTLALTDDVAGTVRIDGALTTATDVIWLHARDLTIDRATIGGTLVEVQPAPLRELVGLVAPKTLAPGRVTIELAYRGRIADNGRVTLTDEYDDSAQALGVFQQRVGDDRYIYTQHEPTYARRVVPCIDEPDRKVPWRLTLEVASRDVALSNTPVVRETVVGARKRVEFARTQPLPSYLFAFAVGPFEVVDAGRSKSGVPLRIFALRGRVADATAAARPVPRLFDAVEELLGVPYAYGKLDFVAVPRTGPNWGGMENAGLVTVNHALLTHGWVGIAAHEIAHHWFGNLVTLAWWNDIWLNEGFTTWATDVVVAQLGVDGIEPERAVPASAMWGEYREPASVRVPAHDLATPEKLTPYFAGFYAARLIVRLERFVGAAKFRSIVQQYLRAHAGGVVATADFGRALGDPALAAALEAYVDAPVYATPQAHAERRCAENAIQIFQRGRLPAMVCLAYEQRGTRVETCRVVEGQQAIPVETCPAWVVAARGTDVTTMTELDVLAGVAWPHLLPVEQQEVLRRAARDDALQLRVAAQLLASPDAEAADAGARYLLDLLPVIAPKQRAAFDAWVLRTIGERARKAFADPRGIVEQPSLIELAAAAGETSIRDEAIRRAAQPLPYQLVYLAQIAIRADRATAQRFHDGYAALPATRLKAVLPYFLARAPDVLALGGTTLRTDGQVTMLSGGCDAAYLARLQRRVPAVTLAEAGVRACMDRRAKLEPVFKVWLARVKASP